MFVVADRSTVCVVTVTISFLVNLSPTGPTHWHAWWYERRTSNKVLPEDSLEGTVLFKMSSIAINNVHLTSEKKDNLSIVVKMAGPNVSFIQRVPLYIRKRTTSLYGTK